MTATSEEIVWGLGQGCNGVVRVLVEPLIEQSGYLAALRRTLATQTDSTRLVVATVFHHSSAQPVPTQARVEIGSRLCLAEGGEPVCDNLNGELALLIEDDAHSFLNDETSGVRIYEHDGERIEVFIETITPPMPLVVFGAGHDALPIIELARVRLAH